MELQCVLNDILEMPVEKSSIAISNSTFLTQNPSHASALALGRFDKLGTETAIMSWAGEDDSSTGSVDLCTIGDPSVETSEMIASSKEDDMQFELLGNDIRLTLRGSTNGDVTVASKRRWDSNSTTTPTGSTGTHNSPAQIVFETSAESVLLEGRKEKIRRTDSTGSNGSRMSGWQVDEIADNLAADLDGLGVDLSAAAASYSEAFLAIPSLAVLKQEVHSPLNQIEQSLTNALVETSSSNNKDNTTLEVNSSPLDSSEESHLQQLLTHQQITASTPNFSTASTTSPSTIRVTTTMGQLDSLHTVAACNTSDDFKSSIHEIKSGTTSKGSSASATTQGIDCRFQYVLAAATSIATKINEETLTYLNQGQSYEIKLKKLGELSAYKGKILKSVIRICFHERRLQYTEREQMASWQASRPGERILEVDVPLSYGIFDVHQDTSNLNTVQFLWDPTKEVGVYIKVNCISTEFTAKKHGGEKGVPFRIQVETHLRGGDRLHAAACQIKVFKLKGADRKHKQDREKILKRTLSEQEKYQPSYECTILIDLTSDSLINTDSNSRTASSQIDSSNVTSSTSNAVSPPALVSENSCLLPVTQPNNSMTNNTPVQDPLSLQNQPTITTPHIITGNASPNFQQENQALQQQTSLSSEAGAQDTAAWLHLNRFTSWVPTFASFAAADLLRLSRDDLIEICGLADGIRLFNALHSKAITPRLTLYLCVESSAQSNGINAEGVFHAIFLSTSTCSELASKMAQLLGINTENVRDVFLRGPHGIHVLMTDEVVSNLHDHSMFIIEILSTGNNADQRFKILLKPTGR